MIRLVKMGVAFAVLMVAGESALAATAGTAANAILQNTAEVRYNNTAGNNEQFEQATSTITVNLVQTAPTIAYNAVDTTDDLTNVSEGETVTVFYDVTSNANGEDTYDLTTADSSTSNYTSSSFSYNDNSFTLGATSIAEAFTIDNSGGAGATECTVNGTGTCAISVPNDTPTTGATDSVINGLEAGETVVLDNGTTTLVCTVASVSEVLGVTETGNFTTLNVNGCDDIGAATFAVAVGSDIFERLTVSVDVTAGNLAAAGDGSTTLSATAETTTNTQTSNTDTGATITIRDAAVNIYKFVRNTSNANAGVTTDPGDGSISVLVFNNGTDGDQTYYTAGVTADPDDLLEYVVLVQHVAGSVTQVRIEDTPGIFTAYESSTIVVLDSGTITCAFDAWNCDVDESGTTSTPTDTENDGDAAEVTAGGTIFIYGGTGANAIDTSTGGDLSSGVTVGAYRVRVAD